MSSIDPSEQQIAALEDEVHRLRAALEPFAAFGKAYDDLLTIHHGKHYPDTKTWMYGQGEEGRFCHALTFGHLRDAVHVFGSEPDGWSGLYRSRLGRVQHNG